MTGRSTKRQQKKVWLVDQNMIFKYYIDKERYEKELRSLESHSDLLKKPKKCLSAYMIFVKETRPLIVNDHPEMGALQVMQEVGKKWQILT